MRHEIVNNVIRTFGEESAASFTEIREENIRPPARGNGLDTGAGLDTGDRIVVNLSKRHLTEAEISFFFCFFFCFYFSTLNNTRKEKYKG